MPAKAFRTGLIGFAAMCAVVFGISPASARQPDPAVVKQQDQVAQKTIEQMRNVLPKTAMAKDK